MAESLGDSVLYIKTDSKQYETGIDKAHKGAQGLDKQFDKTGSKFLDVGAKISQIYMGVVSVFKSVAGAISGMMGEYTAAASAEAQLNAVLDSTKSAAGLTKKEIMDMSSAFQDLTTFGDDAILSAQNILLTFTKIGKDVFPGATEAVLNLSTAMKTDLKSAGIQVGKMLNDPNGMAAAKKLGISFSDAQIAMGKQLFATGKIAEYQKLVLTELNKELGGSAVAARDTFGGALKALGNYFGNVQEAIGAYIATVGRPFVENAAQMTKGVAQFLMSEEGLKRVSSILSPIAGLFSVAWEMAKGFTDVLGGFVKDVSEGVIGALGSIGGKGNEANTTFSILGGIIKTISIGFAIAGKSIKTVIQTIGDLVDSVGKSVGILGKFGEAIADPFNKKKWDAVGSQIKAAGDAFVNLGKNFADNYVDIVKTTINEFKNFDTDAKANAQNLEKAYTTSVKNTNKALLNLQNGFVQVKEIVPVVSDVIEETSSAVKETAEATYTESANLYAAAMYERYRWQTQIYDADLALTKNTEDEIDKRKTAYEEYAKEVSGYMQDIFGSLGESIVGALKGSEDAWQALADAAKESIAKILDGLGEMAIAKAGIYLWEGNILGSIGMAAAGAAAFTGAGIVRALDNGGVIRPGESAIVGEYGPERITAGSSPVTVTSRQDTAKMRPIVINNYVRDDNDITMINQQVGRLLTSTARATR